MHAGTLLKTRNALSTVRNPSENFEKTRSYFSSLNENILDFFNLIRDVASVLKIASVIKEIFFLINVWLIVHQATLRNLT